MLNNIMLSMGLGKRTQGSDVRIYASHDPAYDNERHQRVYCVVCGLRADYSDRLDTWACGCGARYSYELSRWLDHDEAEGELE